MAALQKFRTTLGGFNRRDVLNYIEAADRAGREKAAELEGKLEASERARAELESRLEAIQSEKGAAAAEEAKVRASLEESTLTLGRVRGELSQAETKLAVAKSELARLQAQVEQLEPMAKNYEELKERVAVVELDAHRKAQATVEEAQAQANSIRSETRQWLRGILGQYDRMRQAADEQVKAAARMLEEGGDAAERLRQWGELE